MFSFFRECVTCTAANSARTEVSSPAIAWSTADSCWKSPISGWEVSGTVTSTVRRTATAIHTLTGKVSPQVVGHISYLFVVRVDLRLFKCLRMEYFSDNGKRRIFFPNLKIQVKYERFPMASRIVIIKKKTIERPVQFKMFQWHISIWNVFTILIM